MNVTLTTVDPILRVRDICRLLRISEAQFYVLRERGWFGGDGPPLIEIQPPIDRAPRYSGGPFVSWLSDRQQTKKLRDTFKVAR